MDDRLPCPLCSTTLKSIGSLRHHVREIHRTTLGHIRCGHPIRGRPRSLTHCPSGHEWTEENTYYNPSRPGVRHCRECRRLHEKQRREVGGDRAR